MTAIFSTRRGDFSPSGPVFHIQRKRKRKPAMKPEDREAARRRSKTDGAANVKNMWSNG